jgi:hypothetical protein
LGCRERGKNCETKLMLSRSGTEHLPPNAITPGSAGRKRNAIAPCHRHTNPCSSSSSLRPSDHRHKLVGAPGAPSCCCHLSARSSRLRSAYQYHQRHRSAATSGDSFRHDEQQRIKLPRRPELVDRGYLPGPLVIGGCDLTAYFFKNRIKLFHINYSFL